MSVDDLKGTTCSCLDCNSEFIATEDSVYEFRHTVGSDEYTLFAVLCPSCLREAKISPDYMNPILFSRMEALENGKQG